jgi:hypothetical protein
VEMHSSDGCEAGPKWNNRYVGGSGLINQ